MVDVIDADLEVEAGLSMLVVGKKSLGGEKSKKSLPNNKFKAKCLPKNHINLERCSTYISFFNAELLEDIRQIDTMIYVTPMQRPLRPTGWGNMVVLKHGLMSVVYIISLEYMSSRILGTISHMTVMTGTIW